MARIITLDLKACALPGFEEAPDVGQRARGSSRDAKMANAKAADVIFFPGVRYERWPDDADLGAGTISGGRQTAISDLPCLDSAQDSPPDSPSDSPRARDWLEL